MALVDLFLNKPISYFRQNVSIMTIPFVTELKEQAKAPWTFALRRIRTGKRASKTIERENDSKIKMI